MGSGSISNLKPAGFATDLMWELRELKVLRPPPGFGTENPEDGAAVRRGRKMSEGQVLGDQGFSLGAVSLGLRWEMHVDTGGQPAVQDWVVGCLCRATNSSKRSGLKQHMHLLSLSSEGDGAGPPPRLH